MNETIWDVTPIKHGKIFDALAYVAQCSKANLIFRSLRSEELLRTAFRLLDEAYQSEDV